MLEWLVVCVDEGVFENVGVDLLPGLVLELLLHLLALLNVDVLDHLHLLDLLQPLLLHAVLP